MVLLLLLLLLLLLSFYFVVARTVIKILYRRRRGHRRKGITSTPLKNVIRVCVTSTRVIVQKQYYNGFVARVQYCHAIHRYFNGFFIVNHLRTTLATKRLICTYVTTISFRFTNIVFLNSIIGHQRRPSFLHVHFFLTSTRNCLVSSIKSIYFDAQSRKVYYRFMLNILRKFFG